jgi:molybdopterin-containing oxidoreductase family membrane subunit
MLRAGAYDQEKLINPMLHTSWRFWALVGALGAVIAWGVVMYIRQFQLGLGQTGMQRPVYWGMYMTNFIFFIGISHAGTLISAILRVTGAEWRRPITRMAEAITVFALIVGTLQIIIDMGRPDRLLFIVMYGRLQSPIMWDVVSVTIYFSSSVFYLYLPLIPDVAILRDSLPEGAPTWRHTLYRTLALGWRGNVEQWRRLEKAISFMAIFIIPVAVSVHTIIAWILATTVQPGWHSTVFGPYFVVGAIFSGIGALFLLMSGIRWSLGLDSYIKLTQYRNLGLIFITMTVIWAYFTYAENLTLAAGQEQMEFPVLASKLWGDFAISFWLMIVLMAIAFWVMVVPRLIPARAEPITLLQLQSALLLMGVGGALIVLLTGQLGPSADLPDSSNARMLIWIVAGLALASGVLRISSWFKQHPVTATVVAGAVVLVGMWLERWNIIIPTVTHPRLVQYGAYAPTLTEVALTAGSLALFVLLIVLFFKVFPAVSLWEVAEGRMIEADYAKLIMSVPEPANLPRKKWREFRRF